MFVLLFFVYSTSKGDIKLNENSSGTLIGEQVYFLKPDKELNFQEIKNSSDFEKSENETPNLGFSKNSVWLKFKVTNNTKDSLFLLNVSYPILDEIELYSDSTNSTKSNNKLFLGEVKGFNQRNYQHSDYIYNIKLGPQESTTLFLRIKSIEQLILPISFNKSEDLWFQLGKENLLSGIYIGCVLIMFLYNLFIFFSVRDKSYLYYVIYVAGVGLTQVGIKGYNFQYLWPDASDFQLKSLTFFACISGIAALLFTKNFLHTKQNAKYLDKVLSIIMVILGVSLALTILNYDQVGFKIMQIATTLFAVSIISVSFIVMRKGYSPAKYVFLSWSVLLIGAIIFALKDNGILPYNTFTSYSMQLASAIEMALLSFGLANRINILKKEKELSQAEALRVSKENEQIIKEQNIVLEQKVTERTAELQEANEELHVTLEDLKQTQTQLVAAEKMASLGQLTAGIAHEINNPINFVTSNVSPLQRDVKMLFDTIDTFEELSLSDKSKQEIGQEIEQYKEDLDYDYLKIEIDHLLKGINDGASRTAEIVKGLRIFSRVDEDDLKKANLTDGLDSTLVIMNSLINSNNIVVERDYNAIPPIECYPGKLNQVFLNIISNAIHAVSQIHKNNGNGKLTISVKEEGPNEVSVTFIDNGCGMGDITISKIFDPFFTTKDVGEGTGLGMSIAYNTVKKHNGTIEVSSELSKGTRIKITLPIVHQQQAEA